MKVADQKHDRERLVPPTEDAGVLFAPPADRVGGILAENIRRLQESSAEEDHPQGYDFQGRRLHELVSQCRQEILSAAIAYTRSYRDVPDKQTLRRAAAPLILAGHQPDFLHPGVWAKNFAIHALAAAHGGIAINLLIDTDVPKTAAIKIPSGSLERPVLEKIPVDRLLDFIPYEEWKIIDNSVFENFGGRVAAAIKPLVADPCIRTYWPKVLERARSERRVGWCLAQARHQIEGEWGIETLEVPQSRICDSEPFRWFTAHLLAQLPRLHDIYNHSVAQYRQLHRLRSSAHPVPDLTEEKGWLEAPFWIWDAQNPRRRPLMCRPQSDQLLLTDGKGLELSLTLTPDGDANEAVGQLAAAAQAGIRIRTRALLTTMFTRLLCGDIFVHGIGGGNYDQVTDLIIRRFFGIDPPDYVVFSGTLRLPLPRSRETVSSLRAINGQLRDLKFNPDRYLLQAFNGSDEGSWQSWVQNKRRWIDTPQTTANARTRHLEIKRSNEALQPFVSESLRELQARQGETLEQIRANAILSARDYAFCLFPEEQLSHYLLDIMPQSL